MDPTDLTPEQLVQLRKLLNEGEKSAVERLARAACAFLTMAIDFDLSPRSKRK